MSRASETLRELDIINGWDACKAARHRGGVGVMIAYRPEERGRAYRSAAWQVVRPGFKTDPESHWQNYGNKTFTVFDLNTRAGRLSEAMEWAGSRYGVDSWAKIPGLPGYLFPSPDVAIVKAMIRSGEKHSRG